MLFFTATSTSSFSPTETGGAASETESSPAEPIDEPQENYGWVAGVVIGALAALGILGGVFWFLRKRGQKKAAEQAARMQGGGPNGPYPHSQYGGSQGQPPYNAGAPWGGSQYGGSQPGPMSAVHPSDPRWRDGHGYYKDSPTSTSGSPAANPAEMAAAPRQHYEMSSGEEHQAAHEMPAQVYNEMPAQSYK
jgi:hypothetical protein